MAPRHLTVAGWIGLAVAVVAWCVLNLGLSTSFSDARMPVVPEGTAWTADEITLTMSFATHGTTISDNADDPVTAMPGAVFVVVLIEYRVTNPDTDLVCSVSLQGDGRTWAPSDPEPIGSIFPGTRQGCDARDDDGAPISSGIMGATFEIPAAALPEIEGASVGVVRGATTASDSNQTMFKRGSWSAILAAKVL